MPQRLQEQQVVVAPNATTIFVPENVAKAHQPNRALIAIFVLPLVVIAGLLQGLRSTMPVFNEADQLQGKIAKAKQVGLPFEAQELAPKGVNPKDNTSSLLTEKNISVETPEMRTNQLTLQRILGTAKEIGKRSRLDAHRDLDGEYVKHSSASQSDLERIELCSLALDSDVTEQIFYDKPDLVLQSLKGLINLVSQLADEKNSASFQASQRLQAKIYERVSEAAWQFRANKQALTDLRQLIAEPFRQVTLRNVIESEFYQRLWTLRNLPQNTSQEVIRSELPTGLVAQGQLSQLIDLFEEMLAICDADPDSLETIETIISRLDRANGLVAFSGVLEGCMTVKSYYFLQPLKVLKTEQALCLWGIDILSTYGSSFPPSLPTRKDPGRKGLLAYKRTKQGFDLTSFRENSSPELLNRNMQSSYESQVSFPSGFFGPF